MAERSREIYSWPEARIYLGPRNGETEVAFVENLSINISWEWDRQLSMASGTRNSRVTMTLKDKTVNISLSKLWDGGAFLAQANSATAFNCSISAINGADNVSAAYSVYSALFNSVSLQGSEGQLFKSRASLIAQDISALTN